MSRDGAAARAAGPPPRYLDAESAGPGLRPAAAARAPAAAHRQPPHQGA